METSALHTSDFSTYLNLLVELDGNNLPVCDCKHSEGETCRAIREDPGRNKQSLPIGIQVSTFSGEEGDTVLRRYGWISRDYKVCFTRTQRETNTEHPCRLLFPGCFTMDSLVAPPYRQFVDACQPFRALVLCTIEDTWW